MMLKRVLIAEDDPDIASALARGLRMEGYEPTVAHDGDSALELAQQSPCDAAVIDMMLGDDRGDELVRALRKDGMRGPILILSALSSVEDRTGGLDSGADDYIAKPFDFDELLARLRVHERRRERDGTYMTFAGMTFDPRTGAVTGAGRKETMTEREGDLLELLIRNAGNLMTRGEIFDRLWAKKDADGSENVVDVYIGYLRKKLSPMTDFGADLQTIRARGFMLTELEDE